MKLNYYSLLGLSLLFAFCFGCSESSNSDDPTPTPSPDYSSCKYALNYKLSYSPLSKSKLTTITYLGPDQKVKTATLADTSFSFSVEYKYGDSVYVKISPDVYFANKPVVSDRSTYNKIAVTSILATTASSCPKFGTGSENTRSYTIQYDTLPARQTFLSLLGVSPTRIK